MSNKAAAKGSRYERSLLPLLEAYYPGAYRLQNQGANDKGDFKLPGELRFVIQAKDWNKQSLGAWLDAANKQAGNAGVPVGVVVHKRRGTANPGEQFVTLRLKDFLWLTNPTVSRSV